MANNPYVNKVQYGNQTIIDISGDTVTAGDLWIGVTAHDASGAPIEGTLNVELDTLNIDPTESTQEIFPEDPYWGFDSVTVGAISSDYVGSNITRLTSSDLEVSIIDFPSAKDVSITLPAGYLSSSIGTNGNLSEATFSTATSCTINTNGTISMNFNPSAAGMAYTNSTYSISRANAVTVRTSSDLTASGPTITAPAGYYASSASKSVSTATLPTQPAASGTGTLKATISRSTSDQYINIPVGFVENSAYYKVSAVANMTLPTQAISTSSGTSKATIAVSTSDRYLNIPTGYNGTAQYYKISKISLTTGSATPSETAQTLTPTGYDGFSSVTVGAVSSTYVGSGVTRRSSTSLTVSGDTVTAPAGYYESSASKAVAAMTLPTNTSSSSSGTQKAVITPSSSVQYLNIPTGYNGTAQHYKINAADDSIFLITISWDSAQSLWVPDKTYAQIVAANSAGKTLALETDTNDPNYTVQGELYTEDNYYYYTITEYSQSGPNYMLIAHYYYIDSNGVSDDGEDTYYGLYDADAVPTQVMAGKHFYAYGGYQTGTATVQTQLSISGATVTAASGFYEASVSTTVQTTSLPTATESIHVGTKKAEITAGSSVKYLNITEGYQTGGYYQINAAGVIPEAVLPTQTSSTSSGTKKATISRNTSTRYLNIPTGQVSSSAYYEIEGVPNGSATTPTTTISVTPTISVSSTGLVTASGSTSQNITPTISAGYISSGTAGSVTASASNTYQLDRLTATAYNVSTSDQTIAAGQYITGQQRFKGVVVSNTLTAANIKNGVTITVGDADNASRITSVTGTYTGGSSGPALTLISTTSLGTLSTTNTSATDTSKSLSLASSTGFTDYDLLVVDISVNSTTNNRHTSSVSFVLLTGTSDVNTKNNYAVASNVWNSKLSSSGVASTRQSATKYGIYANSASVSNNTMSIPIYYRYNSNNTGTINGSYTARVYGAKLIDLIGG